MNVPITMKSAFTRREGADEPRDSQKFFGSFFQKRTKKKDSSFLKKRSKKPLSVWRA